MGGDQLIQELRDFRAASELIQSMPQVSGLLGRAADALENAHDALAAIRDERGRSKAVVDRMRDRARHALDDSPGKGVA